LRVESLVFLVKLPRIEGTATAGALGCSESIRDTNRNITCGTCWKLAVSGIGTCVPRIIDWGRSDVKKRK
jgi:hypothetical protein